MECLPREAVVQIAQVEVIIADLIKLQPANAVLKLLHLHLLDELPRHLVPLVLLLGLVLEVAPDDVEDLVFEGEAVAEAALVPHARHEQVLALGETVGADAANVLVHVALREADEEHLVHVLVAVALVDVLQVRILQVHLKHLDSRLHFPLEALLRRHEDQIVVGSLGYKGVALALEDRLRGSTHVPSDGQDAQVFFSRSNSRSL